MLGIEKVTDILSLSPGSTTVQSGDLLWSVTNINKYIALYYVGNGNFSLKSFMYVGMYILNI